jgi:hypothetical protein
MEANGHDLDDPRYHRNLHRDGSNQLFVRRDLTAKGLNFLHEELIGARFAHSGPWFCGRRRLSAMELPLSGM